MGRIQEDVFGRKFSVGHIQEDAFRRRFSGGRIPADASGRRPSRDAYREMCLGGDFRADTFRAMAEYICHGSVL